TGAIKTKESDTAFATDQTQENAYPGTMEEGLPSSFAVWVTGVTEGLRVHKGGGGEHDGLVEEQADLSSRPVPGIDHGQELMHVEQRHVGMHVLGISLEQRVLESDAGEAQGPLLAEEFHILG